MFKVFVIVLKIFGVILASLASACFIVFGIWAITSPGITVSGSNLLLGIALIAFPFSVWVCIALFSKKN